MIVKNEAANIERCLRAVADYVSCWVIGDTGSIDGTPDIIRDFFKARDIPGELHQFPFETFDQARNRALDLARASSLAFDYILFADADMELVVSDPTFVANLTADIYQVRQHSGVAYWNARLLKRSAPARYVGVTHEYLDLTVGTTEQLDGISYLDHASGANRPGKFARDAALLRRALETEQEPGLRARYTFYLANSLRDDGDHAGAHAYYLERARLGHWYEEVFVSLMNAGELEAQLGYPIDDIIATFESATAANPQRAEALHGAARLCRNRGLFERGYHLAARGESIPLPKAGLFVSEWVYAYGLADELAIAAYWTGRYAECVSLCDRLLASPRLPDEYRGRVQKNRQFALDRLAEKRRVTGVDSARFLELLRAARHSEERDLPVEEVVAAYLEAAEAGPGHAEALHGASRFCRYKGLHEKGYHLAVRGLAILEGPHDRVPEEAWIYDYGLLDELAVHAYWTGRDQAAVKACDRLLNEGKIPAHMRDRIVKNRQFSLDRMTPVEKQAAERDTLVRSTGCDAILEEGGLSDEAGPSFTPNASARSDTDLGTNSASAISDLQHVAQIFEKIHYKELRDNRSGPGSSSEINIGYLAFLYGFLVQNRIKSVVDFGCGDWQFSRFVNWDGMSYLGLDVVTSVVAQNRIFETGSIKFEKFVSDDQIPLCDLIICKDVFQHLPNAMVNYYINIFRTRARFILVTNDDFVTESSNGDTRPGGWRPLRLEISPFYQRCAYVFGWSVVSHTPPAKKATVLIHGDLEAERLPRKVTASCFDADTIPNRIFQTWKVRSPLPAKFAYWQSTIRTLNSNFEYVIWSDDDNRNFIQSEFPSFLRLYDSYPREIFRVDMVRYFYLYRFGGFYMDLDVECRQPLDRYLPLSGVLLGKMGTDDSFEHSIPNAIMASSPRQGFWLFVISRLAEAPENSLPEWVTGPVFLHRCLRDYEKNDTNVNTKVIEGVTSRMSPQLRDYAYSHSIALLSSKEWYALDWSDRIHARFRLQVLSGPLLSEQEKSDLFPNSTLLTYWSHSW